MASPPDTRQQKMSPTAARTLRSKRTGLRPARDEPPPQLLLASQLIFNIGFYAVVPFLAVTMRNDFGMGAMAIGIVLGGTHLRPTGNVPVRWGACRPMGEHASP